MHTKISTKGQVVLPSRLRRLLGLKAGDRFGVHLEAGRIVLTPRREHAGRAKIVSDPVTGLPVLRLSKGAPVLSSKQVDEILADFS